MSSRLRTREYRILLAIALCAVSLPLYSARREPSQEQRSTARQTDTSQRPRSTGSAGEIKFKQNCSRCHEAPPGFSSRISGTILRHMRVRANLSEADEREILHFLNP